MSFNTAGAPGIGVKSLCTGCATDSDCQNGGITGAVIVVNQMIQDVKIINAQPTLTSIHRMQKIDSIFICK